MVRMLSASVVEALPMTDSRDRRTFCFTAVCALGVSLLAAAPVFAATFVVNVADDVGDCDPDSDADGSCEVGVFDQNLVCQPRPGTCTLREALQEANGHPGPDAIHFAIGGGGSHEIAVGKKLPTLAEVADVDGETQPGFDTVPLVLSASPIAARRAPGAASPGSRSAGSRSASTSGRAAGSSKGISSASIRGIPAIRGSGSGPASACGPSTPSSGGT
jgi:hypothetical protein